VQAILKEASEERVVWRWKACALITGFTNLAIAVSAVNYGSCCTIHSRCALALVYSRGYEHAGRMRPTKEFRAARETFRRDQQLLLLFVSVDEQLFSFLPGFIV